MMTNPVSADHKLTIALITNDPVGERMAGPGIRYWELAHVLGKQFQVKLIIPPFVSMEATPSAKGIPFSLHVCSRLHDFRRLVESCEVIITLGVVLLFYPFLAELEKPLVLDLYNPFLLENLSRQAKANLAKQVNSHEGFLDALRTILHFGDFFVCASEKQRDYWLGTLSTMGRINPYTYQQDPTLRNLIDVVPFGLSEKSPQHTKPVMKGVVKNISAKDKVILWGGGIWNWFDAPTLIKAMPLILKERTDVKLVFMGTKHPNKNSAIAWTRAVDEAMALSKEFDLFDRFIFLGDWVPYDERQNYLLEADIGISLHRENIETRFSFRTRLLDYLWAGLPVVSTSGDVMSEVLAQQDLAYLVAPGDVAGVADTILTLLNNLSLRTDYAARFQQVADQYRWEVVAQPLVKFCSRPYIAPDKSYLQSSPLSATPKTSSLGLLAKSRQAIRLGGISGLLQQGSEYIRWKIGKHNKL